LRSRRCYRRHVGHPRIRCCRNGPVLPPMFRFPAECQRIDSKDVCLGRRTCFNDILLVFNSQSSVQTALANCFPTRHSMRAPCNTSTCEFPFTNRVICSYGSVLLVESSPRARSWRNSKAGSSRYENSFKEYNVGLELHWSLRAIVKRRGWLECALGANCDHVLKLNYQSMVEGPISRRGGIKWLRDLLEFMERERDLLKSRM
jgi:hypothetical protein